MSRITPKEIKSALDRYLDEAVEDFRHLLGESISSNDDAPSSESTAIAEFLFPEAIEENGRNETIRIAKEIEVFLEEPLADPNRNGRSCRDLCRNISEIHSDLFGGERNRSPLF
jgi:hypothetical protein